MTLEESTLFIHAVDAVSESYPPNTFLRHWCEHLDARSLTDEFTGYMKTLAQRNGFRYETTRLTMERHLVSLFNDRPPL